LSRQPRIATMILLKDLVSACEHLSVERFRTVRLCDLPHLSTISTG